MLTSKKSTREIAEAVPRLRERWETCSRRLRPVTRRKTRRSNGIGASTHYRRLWIGCTKAEKVVLAHIAEDGLVNAKSRPIVRSLRRKGLIRACPDFRLMNTTFERFVLSGPQQVERLAFESGREASTWDKFQLPFAAIMAGALLFFVVTQKSMFD